MLRADTAPRAAIRSAPRLCSTVRFMNFYPFADIETVSPRPLLFITGDSAHSREFSEDAYRLAAEPKALHSSWSEPWRCPR